jgi:hypothetical protein
MKSLRNGVVEKVHRPVQSRTNARCFSTSLRVGSRLASARAAPPSSLGMTEVERVKEIGEEYPKGSLTANSE